jgi:uncharacterized protein (TIGR00106 family)
MPIMEISVVPLGTKTSSLSKYVAGCLRLLRKEKGIKYELSAMGTNIECASLRRLFLLAEKMHRRVFSIGANRVLTLIKIDDRRDKPNTIKGKLDSVKAKF